jgi:hypothetical protein
MSKLLVTGLRRKLTDSRRKIYLQFRRMAKKFFDQTLGEIIDRLIFRCSVSFQPIFNPIAIEYAKLS